MARKYAARSKRKGKGNPYAEQGRNTVETNPFAGGSAGARIKQRVQEDSPRFNPSTMGNGRSGKSR